MIAKPPPVQTNPPSKHFNRKCTCIPTHHVLFRNHEHFRGELGVAGGVQPAQPELRHAPHQPVVYPHGTAVVHDWLCHRPHIVRERAGVWVRPSPPTNVARVTCASGLG